MTALTFSPDGKFVASACCNSEKRSIRLWNPVTLKDSQNIPSPDRVSSLSDLTFSPDGKQIAGVSMNHIDQMEFHGFFGIDQELRRVDRRDASAL